VNINREVIIRNHGFIPEQKQQKIADSVFLIAGCGSIGGSSVELLVRTGARKFILADPDTYDYTNLNRQSAGYGDVGRNKAELMGNKIVWVNPECNVDVYAEGLTEENIPGILAGTDIVIDGVDVTTHSGWAAKYALHKAAKRYRLPVISGYDMDATQYTVFHDYRDESEPLFKGRVDERQTRELAPLDTCLLLITPKNMPLGIFEELERIAGGEKDYISQLGIAANLFGVIAVSMALRILNGEKVEHEIYMDMLEMLGAYTPSDEERLQAFRDAYAQKTVRLQKETA